MHLELKCRGTGGVSPEEPHLVIALVVAGSVQCPVLNPSQE